MKKLLICMLAACLFACHDDLKEQQQKDDTSCSTCRVEEAFPGKTGEPVTLTVNGKEVYAMKIEDQYVLDGDIILTETQLKGSAEGRTGSVGTSLPVTRWPNRTVAYMIDPLLPNQQRVIDAIAHWQSSTRIQFVVRTTETNYVKFVPTVDPRDGCSSNIGMVGGQQLITLRDECTTGNVIHEIGHAVGLWHEQCRADRDNFVTVNWGNVDPDKVNNFKTYGQLGQSAMDIAGFDFGSIMLYSSYDFSLNGLPTLVKKNGSTFTAQRTALSDGDKFGVAYMYDYYQLTSGQQWYDGPGSYSTETFLMGDVNGDSKSDVVLVTPSAEKAQVWLSRGDGFYDGTVWVDGPFNYSGHVFNLADVTGDGKADLVGINPSTERMLVWQSLGNAFSTGAQWLDGPFNYSGHIFQVADVNADGKADVVGINAASERLLVWESRGDGFYNGAEWLDGPFDYSSHSFHVADFTGDGKADIAGVNPSTERMIVWESRGDGFYNGGEWLDGPFAYVGHIFNAGDMNGDGKADITAVNRGDERILVWRSRGDGFFNGAEWMNGPFSYTDYQFKVGDVNGDGKADVVGFYLGTERIVVWLTK